MNTAGSLSKNVGIKRACDALVIPRASFSRWRDKDKHSMKDNRCPVAPLALTYDERNRFANKLLNRINWFYSSSAPIIIQFFEIISV